MASLVKNLDTQTGQTRHLKALEDAQTAQSSAGEKLDTF